MLYFITSNEDKFREVSNILKRYSISIAFKHANLLEIQADSIEDVAIAKVKDAYDKVKDEVIVEDDGLFIDALNGFPSIYSSYVFKTIGNKGILKLMEGIDDRYAKFVSTIAYYNGSRLKLFKGVVEGMIAREERGISWGYDPIFIPKGYSKTYAELKDKKDQISHRGIALRLFAEWYK